ncbi:hypothetical protein O181_123567 [Austropuccinia psidii MF-1]|uniref:Uncharacterized protein n=1 Tax=Austropuccinia psidii MF-1 TaxID=1389203 RepID=A0A9Q3Q5J4_9BASI|nr:hypothetical protein [Austropuccinia psidii MF-1]
MEITLELDTRYHERQEEKGRHQDKKLPVTGSNSSRPPQDSSSKRPHHKKNKKGNKFKASKDKPHSALLNKDNKVIGSEKERRIKEGFLIVVEKNQLKNGSSDLRTSLGHEEASCQPVTENQTTSMTAKIP